MTWAYALIGSIVVTVPDDCEISTLLSGAWTGRRCYRIGLTGLVIATRQINGGLPYDIGDSVELVCCYFVDLVHVGFVRLWW